MGVIKSSDAPVSVSPFSMADIESAARKILLRARAQAEQIIAAAQAEAETLKAEAIAQGQGEGMRQGLKQGLEQGTKTGHDKALADHSAALTKIVQSLTGAMKQLDDSRVELQSKGLGEVIELACAIARRVTKRQGLIDPAVMCENLKEAMGLAVHAADVRIALNPAQIKTLEAELPNLRLAWPRLKHVELIADASIAPGGVRVFTAGGQVDGDLDAQLDRVTTALLPEPATP